MSLFLPKSGGRFDPSLLGNEIRITHKFGTVNDSSRPVPEEEFQQWSMRFTQLIQQHWEGKYSFRRQNQTVVPKFIQIFEDDEKKMSDAHFVIRVRDGKGGNELVSSKPAQMFEDLKEKGMYFPMASTLAAGSVLPTDSSGLIGDTLWKWIPFYVDTFGGVMKPQTKAHVASIARQVAGAQAGLTVYVTGYGNYKTSSINEVSTVLRASGLLNVQTRTSKKFLNPGNWGKSSQSRASGRTDYVKISIKDDINVSTLKTTPVYTYPAAVVHEFGHMLGLKDEYACLSEKSANQLVKLDFIDASEKNLYLNNPGTRTETPEVQEEQKQFIKYCRKAGVEPTVFGKYTTSIMSAGSEFRPCHFVTIWAALVHLSGFDDWTIV